MAKADPGGLYRRTFAPVLGFHATERTTAEKVIAGELMLAPSENAYDWLGHGIYFWEKSFERARQYGEVQVQRGKLFEPVVLGAVLDLGRCLDLTEVAGIQEIVDAHAVFESLCSTLKLDPPKNRPFRSGGEKLIRELDCGVFNTLHEMRARERKPRYDSIRAVFTEGPRAYQGTTFQKLTHVQLVMLNANCIKGYFWARSPVRKPYVVAPTFDSYWSAKNKPRPAKAISRAR